MCYGLNKNCIFNLTGFKAQNKNSSKRRQVKEYLSLVADDNLSGFLMMLLSPLLFKEEEFALLSTFIFLVSTNLQTLEILIWKNNKRVLKLVRVAFNSLLH